MLIVLVYSKYSMACTNIIRTMQQVDTLPPIDTICVDSQDAKKMVKNSRVAVKSVPTFLVFNQDGRVEVYDGISAIQFINEMIRSSMPPPPPPMPRVLPLPNEEVYEPPPPPRGGYAPPANRPAPKRKEYVPEVVPPENEAVSAIVSSAVLKERRPAEEMRNTTNQPVEDNYGSGAVPQRAPYDAPPERTPIAQFAGMNQPDSSMPDGASVGIPSTPSVPGRSKGGKVDISAILAQAQAEQQQRGLPQQ